jgi:phosphoribosylglycinamide formyltransferase-1
MAETQGYVPARPMRIAILISGTGTNMVAIIDAIKSQDLDAEIACVVSSNEAAKGIEKARSEGLEVIVFKPADYADPESVDAKLVSLFASLGVDYVVMAGYMRKVTSVLLNAYPNRVVNLHPALLPKHRGAHAIQDAFDAGDEVTGITIHFANEEYDKGPIVFQHTVPIIPGETLDKLETRIHDAEHAYYPRVLQMLAQGRVRVQGADCIIDE